MRPNNEEQRLRPEGQRYLEQLQKEINSFRDSLKEFDKLAASATDQRVREVLNNARGEFLGAIEARRLEWCRYIVSDPQRDAWKAKLLNTDTSQ